ncbi:MAG: trypsin-like peptidase domain-containing protein [Spirochaetes bacterium]|nr:trypsin-like peptidase domain-containing protein [Spirochaetota bacterium]
MKKTLVVFLLLSSFRLFCTDIELETMIFEKYEQSVVYLDQTLYFDSNNVSNPDIFKKIEEKYEIEILNIYFSIMSGTGFFITKDGKLLTNYHVIKKEDINNLKKKLYTSLISTFFSKIPSLVITRDEYRLLKEDLKNLINDSEFNYRILVNNIDSYIVEVLDFDEELDAALLKTKKTGNFEPILLGDSDLLKVGNSIMAIGYPLPKDIFYAVREFKSTLTTGKISALRIDDWGIQHTSAISPGNSGGPLFNKNGQVVGINVGEIKIGNDIFFAISINKITDWLNNTKYSSLVLKNKKDASALGKKYKPNKEGYLEVGRMMLVKLKEGYKVYLDNKFKGKTPMLFEFLPTGKHTIKIESDTEYIKEKLLVNKKIKEIFNYEPMLKKYTGNLFVNTRPTGASIFIDERKIEISPTVIDNVSIGKRRLKLILDGYITHEQVIDIKKDKLKKILVDLIKGCKILFNNKLPRDSKVSVFNESKTTSYYSDENILLKPGKWTVIISGDKFAEKTYELELIDKDITLDFTPDYHEAYLVFTNLKETSRVYIDNTNVTSQIKENRIKIKTGKHKLKIISKKYEIFIKEIMIEKNKDKEINIDYKIKRIINKRIGASLFIPGISSFVVGTIFWTIGLAVNLGLNNFQIEESSLLFPDINLLNNIKSYEEYFNAKNATLGLFISGLVLTGLGTTFIIVSIPFFYKSYKKLSFNFECNKNIKFCLSYKF